VYLELKKKYQELYFLSENYEIDFFIPKENTYIQAVYELNLENLEREVKYLSKQN
jgi:predicted AAA+ superfamily ATPase